MRRSRRRTRGQSGVVLFEVLVSTAILSAGCLVLIGALATAMKGTRTLQDRYLAALAVEDTIWGMDHSGGNYDALQVQTPGGFQNAEWSSQQNTTPAGNLNQNSVTIRWTSLDSTRDNHQEDFTLSTYYKTNDATTAN
jgi:Tfp pilus assembly protein PilV